ncbi:MAG: HNH endonuclease family protein [Arcobacteraceae bacterium]|nr:HNH endonuclease family protein [Arcobacteraceae bacterium]
MFGGLIKNKYKQYYIELFDASHYDQYLSYKLDNLLTVMKATLPADFWISPLLRFYDKFKKDRLFEFLKKLDNKFSYDWIIQFTPTTRIENMAKIISQIDAVETIDDLFASDVFDVDENNLINILGEDIYGRRFARYVLYKLDYLYSSKDDKMNIPKTISVEHILPQNPKDGSQWKKDFTDIQIEDNKHKIGNLVLISRSKNSSQGNLDYDKKKEKYFQKNIDLFRNSLRILTLNDTWTLEKLQENQKNVIEKLRTYYC